MRRAESEICHLQSRSRKAGEGSLSYRNPLGLYPQSYGWPYGSLAALRDFRSRLLSVSVASVVGVPFRSPEHRIFLLPYSLSFLPLRGTKSWAKFSVRS